MVPAVAIGPVAGNRVADVLEVDAKLMGPAALEVGLHQREVAVPLQNHELGACLASAGARRHPLAVALSRPMGASMAASSSARSPWTSSRYFFSAVRSLNCIWSAAIAAVVRPITISPEVSLSSRWTMPGPLLAGRICQVGEAGQQGVDERAVLVAGRGVDDQARRLVHHDHRRVLVDDRQRDVCGRRGPRSGRSWRRSLIRMRWPSA